MHKLYWLFLIAIVLCGTWVLVDMRQPYHWRFMTDLSGGGHVDAKPFVDKNSGCFCVADDHENVLVFIVGLNPDSCFEPDGSIGYSMTNSRGFTDFVFCAPGNPVEISVPISPSSFYLVDEAGRVRAFHIPDGTARELFHALEVRLLDANDVICQFARNHGLDELRDAARIIGATTDKPEARTP